MRVGGSGRDGLRIAGMGFALADRRWTRDFAYSGAESLLGHDIVVWDVAGSVGPYTVTSTDIDRRDAELREHLNEAKPLVILLPAARAVRVPIDDPYLALEPVERSIASLLPLSLEVVSAQGRAFGEPAPGPFATFWELARDAAEYASFLAVDVGQPLLQIRGSACTVAAHVRERDARVLLLPRLPDHYEVFEEATAHDPNAEVSWHVELTNALIALLDVLGTEAPLPAWADRVLLPGEEELRTKRERAEAAIGAAEQRRDRAELALYDLTARKHLIASDGPALEEAVAQALRALGFEVDGGPSGRADLVARLGKKTAVVEVKGLTRSAKERDVAQLGKWVFEHHAEHGRQPKGILVANAWRSGPPAGRTQAAFPNQMRTLAEPGVRPRNG